MKLTDDSWRYELIVIIGRWQLSFEAYEEYTVPVHHFIWACLVESIVEPEQLIFQIFGQIDFVFWLVHDQLVLARDRDNVDFFPTYFFFV